MLQKLVKCGVVGGLVLFVWGMISWSILPWHKMHMHKFSNEGSVADVIVENAPESGLYILPNLMNLKKNSDDYRQAQEKMNKGPFIFASVSLDGAGSNLMGHMIKGLILKIVAASLVTWLLLHTKLNYNKKVGFVTMVGVIIALMATLPYWIWFAFPAGFTVACMFEIVFGWFFAGLVIGKLVK